MESEPSRTSWQKEGGLSSTGRHSDDLGATSNDGDVTGGEACTTRWSMPGAANGLKVFA
jgi:hypothetical protein